MSRPTRILIVDDNPEIHSDFEKVLRPVDTAPKLKALEAALFGDEPAPAAGPQYRIDHASQGQEALDMVRAAEAEKYSYALAFVDVRMPPGWDGIETIGHLRKVAPQMSFVVCTAYSDYEPDEAREKVGLHDGMAFIGKPFDPEIVRDFAKAASGLRIRAA